MTVFKFLAKHAALPTVLISSCLSAETPLGIVEGNSGSTNVVALISPSGQPTFIDFGAVGGRVFSVAINASGTAALIGGRDSTNATHSILFLPSYAGDGATTILVTPDMVAATDISKVAINNSSQGLIVGNATGGPTPYAVSVSPSGVATTIAPLLATGGIFDAAINEAGVGIIGGATNLDAVSFAAFVSPNGVASANLLTQAGRTAAVAINNSGQALIGGNSTAVLGPAYAALVSPGGAVTQLVLGLQGRILSAAINSSNQGIIGGFNSGGPAYAALVSPAGSVNPISTGLLFATGQINSVAINDVGQAIIGGRDGLLGVRPAYAALVSPSGQVTIIATGITNGTIESVAINSFGQGLIGGRNTGNGSLYTAIVSPLGVATPLNIIFTLPTQPVSVSMTRLPAQIPTSTLGGNNLRFANYINQDAPQDVFYFIPAMFDGTLEQALESSVPTRNAISLYTASNTPFYLNTHLSDHLRNTHRLRSQTSEAPVAVEVIDLSPSEMTASMAGPKAPVRSPHSEQTLPSTLWWLDGIGAWGKQKSQKQTVGFSPTTGAAILGFDAILNAKNWVGLGAAYSYTHVHEKHHAGHSTINQEYFFLYGSYQGSPFYIDGALWGSLFQIQQVRNIHMTGFEFTAHSHPSGWQLTPHLEFGSACKNNWITLDPFVMIDWVNSWQGHYKETSGGPFKSGQKEHYSSLLRAEIGMRFYQTISFTAWRLSFEEKGSYVYKKPFSVGHMRAFLVGSPGTFTVETLTAPQNLGVAAIEVIFESTREKYPYATIAYQGEFGSSSHTNQVSVELAWNF